MRIEMPEKRKKYDREFREGAVRISRTRRNGLPSPPSWTPGSAPAPGGRGAGWAVGSPTLTRQPTGPRDADQGP